MSLKHNCEYQRMSFYPVGKIGPMMPEKTLQFNDI